MDTGHDGSQRKNEVNDFEPPPPPDLQPAQSFSLRKVFSGNAESLLYRQAKISYCIGGIWACGLCYFVPDWMRIGYDTQHKFPRGFTVATVRHDQPVGNAPYVPSIYAADA